MCVISFALNQSDVKAEENLELVTDAYSAVLLEPKTLQVIYEKNSLESRHPASMTKIMTMLLVMEALKNKVLTLDQKLVTSEYAESMGGTQIYLEVNEEMSVNDLLKSVAIASANDAAVVLAEGIGGSVDNFVKMMNNKAKEIGAKNTTFMNPNGLDQEGHLSCAYDMAIMGAYLVNNYGDQILNYTSKYEDYVRADDPVDKFWLVNTNKLIKTNPLVDGLKTGWTDEAGYCLTATASKDNMRFIAVTMGNSSPVLRNKEIMQMLNYAMSTYEFEIIYNAQDVIDHYENVNVVPTRFNVVIERDLVILKKKGETLKDIRTEKFIDFSKIPGDKYVGTIKLYYNNKLYQEAKLVVKEDIEKASFFDVFFEVMKEIFLVS